MEKLFGALSNVNYSNLVLSLGLTEIVFIPTLIGFRLDGSCFSLRGGKISERRYS